MNILVEPTELLNAGDAAMMQVAVARLRERWPDAAIHVFGDSPELVRSRCPGVVPVDTLGRHLWFEEQFLEANSFSGLSEPSAVVLREAEHLIRSRCPKLARLLLRIKFRHDKEAAREIDRFLGFVARADLLFACGMGGITDEFPDFAYELLGTMSLGMRYGARTAIVGQGIGPLDDKALRRYAGTVLPRIDFISLREGKIGLPLLRALGASANRVLVTGDDAIQPAYERRSERLEKGLGLNLRVAGYSGFDMHLVEQVRDVVRELKCKHGMPLIGIPISLAPGETDATTIRRLLSGLAPSFAGGMNVDTPTKVMEQVSQCRIVLTGSYHAAVFSLAMGVPAVTLAKSTYYKYKFQGLSDLFGPGCTVVDVGKPFWQHELQTAAERAWQSAELFRSGLLSAARRQIELTQIAYERVYGLFA